MSAQLADHQRTSEARHAALAAEADDWRGKHAACAAAANDVHLASERRWAALQAELSAAQEESAKGRREVEAIRRAGEEESAKGRREIEAMRRAGEEAAAGAATTAAEAARWQAQCQEARQAGGERAQALEERVRALQVPHSPIIPCIHPT